jgi:hypothetical protein
VDVIIILLLSSRVLHANQSLISFAFATSKQQPRKLVAIGATFGHCQSISECPLRGTHYVSDYLSLQETLRKAEETFGPDNKDLYEAFEGLLSRHLPS